MEGTEACGCSGVVESLAISFVVAVVAVGVARTWGDRCGESVNESGVALSSWESLALSSELFSSWESLALSTGSQENALSS